MSNNDIAKGDEQNEDNSDLQAAKRQKTSLPDRPTRNRKQPERLGQTEGETNDDALFDKANSNYELTATDQETDSETSELNFEASSENGEELKKKDEILASMSPGEKVIYKMLSDVVVDVRLLKQKLIQMESNMGSSSKSALFGIPRTVKQVKYSDLTEIGLPITTLIGLGKFNFNLTNADFEKKAFEILQEIGGTEGEMNHDKIVREIFSQLAKCNENLHEARAYTCNVFLYEMRA